MTWYVREPSPSGEPVPFSPVFGFASLGGFPSFLSLSFWSVIVPSFGGWSVVTLIGRLLFNSPQQSGLVVLFAEGF